MEITAIRNQLNQLHLMLAAQEIESIVNNQKKAISLSWVSELLEVEISGRKTKNINARIKSANFPKLFFWETFDWSFTPQLDQEGLEALRSLEFLKNNRIVQFLGFTGTGKTHLATALGILAAQQGYRVYWCSAKILQSQIHEAKMKNQLNLLFKRILSSKLWIFDDFGVITCSKEVAEEVFDLIDRRKNSSALILTSNRDVSEWPKVFPDLVLANATIDRMFENAQTFLFTGDSYRIKRQSFMKSIDNTKN
jgi:DNA replication protein DnaC